jgi:hypothetical protein
VKVLNIHQRTIAATPEQVGRLIDSLSSDDDLLWPHARWHRMTFDRPLQIGARGGHGPIRYDVEAYEPGRSIRFRFTGPRGFNGYHGYDLTRQGEQEVILRNTLQMTTSGPALLSWPLVFRPLHDALIEDSLARAQKSMGEDPDPPPWSRWVRTLRWVLTGGKAGPQNLLLVVLLGVLLCGCRGNAVRTTPRPSGSTGTAEMEILGPPPRREPTVEDLEKGYPTDLQAFARRQAKPDYPPEAVDGAQECTARILFHVEVDGTVTLVRLEWDPEPDSGFLQLFEDSIRNAMAGWEYSPAHRIITTEKPDGSIDSKAIPIKSADRVIIRFRIVDGKGVVE